MLKFLHNEFAKRENSILIKNINGVSNKVRFALERAGIYSIHDLLLFTKSHNVTEIRGAGVKIENEVNEIIEKYKNHTLDYVEYDSSKKAIKDVYSANRYNRFVQYCNGKGIIYLDDLAGFDFESLKNVEGIGECKYREIVNIYEQNASEGELKYFNEINEDLKDVDVSILEYFGITGETIEKLKKAGYEKVGLLENIKRKDLIVLMRNNDFEKITSAEETLKKNLKELIEADFESFVDSKDSYQNRESTIIIKRADGETLRSIGEYFGITKQRAQMIESGWYKRTGYLIEPYIFKLASEKNYIEEKELEIYENDLYNKMLKYWCSKSYVYVSSEKIFVKKENIKTK